MDDETTLLWVVSYNPSRPLGKIGNYIADSAIDPNNFVPADFTRENNHWNQDREAMAQRRSYSGLGIGTKAMAIFLEDFAVCESMGGIVDRTNENLGPADLVVSKGRRIYRQALQAHMDSARAVGADYDVAKISLPDGPENLPLNQDNQTRAIGEVGDVPVSI
jgi:hypothetical protein